MRTFPKTVSAARRTLFVFAAVALMTSCQTNNDFEAASKDADLEIAAAGEVNSNVTSLTITGANTEFSPKVDCAACTYFVDAKTNEIDGAALGLKAGSVICLNAALKYGNLSFVNLEGTAEKPIIIGNCTR